MIDDAAIDNRQFVVDVIMRVAEEFNQRLERRVRIEDGEGAGLFGREGVLDSLGLVAFIIAVEQAVEESTGASVILADENAMSRSRGPFRTIGSLADHVVNVVSQEGR